MIWQSIVGKWPCRIFRLFALILSSFTFYAQAQEIKVNGGFLSDSLKIGEETAYFLSARYRSDLDILFPDTTHGFTPFEYRNRKFFPTETKDGVSFDSAVYYLSTFEVDRVQYLELPVFIVQPGDCTIYRSPRDSVLITQLVAKVPDSLSVDKLPLKINTAYQQVFFEFNTWVLIIGVALLLLIAAVGWFFFGNRLIKYFKARKLVKEHSRFMETYASIVSQLQSTFSSMKTEAALTTWKKYMEQLEATPYTKLTTKETLALVHDEGLALNLRMIDRSVYGHDTSVIEPLESLRKYADQRFTKKLEEVKHGK